LLMHVACVETQLMLKGFQIILHEVPTQPHHDVWTLVQGGMESGAVEHRTSNIFMASSPCTPRKTEIVLMKIVLSHRGNSRFVILGRHKWHLHNSGWM